MASSIDSAIPRLTPIDPLPSNSATSTALITALSLRPHIEGGHFAELDRDPRTVPNPFPHSRTQQTALKPFSGDNSIRNASTSIYYYLSGASPVGCFHRNKARTVHTLISGRGRYVVIHGNEEGEEKRVETFVVGRRVERGERCVWVVEGEKWKASFLLPGEDGEGLLISETVVPGFEYSDHDFLTREKFEKMLNEEQKEELAWLVRTGPPPEESQF